MSAIAKKNRGKYYLSITYKSLMFTVEWLNENS